VVLPKFPRGARTGTVAKKWAGADVEKKFAETRHAKKIAVREKRSNLSDFERFVVARLKKQVSTLPKKEYAIVLFGRSVCEGLWLT